MLDRLPTEIIGLIALSLSQSDCYHLMLCNKAMYHASLQRLYDSIIVDSTNQIYHKELLNFNDTIKYRNRKYKSTVIKTCNGLKQFFRTLEREERLMNLINYIKVVKLPDHFIEFELAKHFKFLFGKLNNLKGCDFQYSSCFINLDDLVYRLPMSSRLVELTGDFTTTMSLKKKKRNGLSNLSHVSNDLELQKLSMINFQNSAYLKDVSLPITLNKLSVCRNQVISFPVNYSLVNTIGIDFNYLQDCFNKYFYNGMTNELQTDMRAIFNRSNSNHNQRSGQDVDFNTVKLLFHNTPQILYLDELRFDGITFTKDDGKVLNRHCDLTRLKKLTVMECDETLDSYWLEEISSSMRNLKELNISLENLLDLPNFLYQIDSLDKVYINIHDSNIDCDYLSLFKSLNKHKQLTRLIIDSNFENQLRSIPIKLLEKKLIRLNKLTKLRITISIRNLSRFIYNVLPYLDQLQYLELIFEEFNVVNGNTSTSAYMMNEDPFYDNDDEDYEFNMNKLTPNLLTLDKVKKINEQIIYNCPTVQYCKIFSVLLTNDNCTKERGLEKWFTEKLL